ncbi:cyclase [Alkalibacterium putridalgicola]|uniref:Imidazole glycerol phosphate synthase subunit HisF n=1 Tax=Alkalibacterium putridalgicola TaxID=426703 RepID=A0A1H7TNF6_9LACT|nr:imidazole glycerol phosphate synthase subunit HisF [Alkalibacterium putridalgicola]GEK88189.1 imidazole glycerol phosphate synthase subunit HisF [Alkalibacterium putridalgicola]SEL86218.1 cyclase [Alkalibacterium putridalgicola]
MIKKRIIPCLDVRDGVVVKGIQFKGLREIGDPVELAKRYNTLGADELVFLDISATHTGNALMLDVIRETAKELFIPMTIGGGLKSSEDISAVLNAGADKVSLNSAALNDPSLINETSEKFGSQCICIAIDAKWEEADQDWYCYTHGGKKKTEVKALDWVKEVEARGAGELLITSMDYDGMQQGFDHELLKKIKETVTIPVIASGGAGNAQHFADLFQNTDVSAGLAASIFHDEDVSIHEVKDLCQLKGVPMRHD